MLWNCKIWNYELNKLKLGLYLTNGSYRACLTNWRDSNRIENKSWYK